MRRHRNEYEQNVHTAYSHRDKRSRTTGDSITNNIVRPTTTRRTTTSTTTTTTTTNPIPAPLVYEIAQITTVEKEGKEEAAYNNLSKFQSDKGLETMFSSLKKLRIEQATISKVPGEWKTAAFQYDYIHYLVRHVKSRTPRMLESARTKHGLLKTQHEQFLTSMCSIAWLKMYEILCIIRFNMPGSPYHSNNTFACVSVSICEAPGAFVCALQLYLIMIWIHLYSKGETVINDSSTSTESKRVDDTFTDTLLPGCSHTWIASSLLEEGEMKARKDFMTSTANHWLYGPDKSGNLLRPTTIESIVTWANDTLSKHPDGVDIVTGDGGIDCEDCPEAQEERCFPLIYASYVTGLRCLHDGGTLVLKMFSKFHPATRQLLHHAATAFKVKSHIMKPSSSKTANSEDYLVCTGFRRNDFFTDTMKDRMMSWIGVVADKMVSWSFELTQKSNPVLPTITNLLPTVAAHEPSTRYPTVEYVTADTTVGVNGHDDIIPLSPIELDLHIIYHLRRYYEQFITRQCNHIQMIVQHQKQHKKKRSDTQWSEKAAETYWTRLVHETGSV